MSRSQPTAKNPATRFIQWGGAEGTISYYDKEAEESVDMPFSAKKPFVFLVLDELNTITGFSEADHSGFWSNEVRNTTTDVLTVKTKSGVKGKGLYGDISANIKSQGAKFAISVYIAFKDESGELVIGNIKMAGAALTAWIEFKKKWDVQQIAVKLTGKAEAKKGTNTYYTPVFEAMEVSDATNAQAVALDRDLQQYLSIYFSQPALDEPVVVEDFEVEVDLEETNTEESKPAKKKAAPVVEENDDDSIDIGEVPF